MIDKLNEVARRFEEVNELVCNPDIVSDQEKYTKLMREIKHLTPVVEKFREYKKANEAYEESKAMHNGNTPEDKKAKMKDLEEYMKEISEDVTKLISDATPEEKSMVKTKMQTLMQKF